MHIQQTTMGPLNREKLSGSTLKLSLSKSENSFPFETASRALDGPLLLYANLLYIKLCPFSFIHQKDRGGNTINYNTQKLRVFNH